MARLRYTAAAQDDLGSIALYIAEQSGSRAVAERFTGELRAKCRDLARLSGRLGRPRRELRADMRSFAYKNYLIFFRYAGETVEIVNVVESHRDIEALFRDDKK
jgi:plasmid stabilization system protein ParE